MRNNVLLGIIEVKQWRKRKPGERPTLILNHLKRNFTADSPNLKVLMVL